MTTMAAGESLLGLFALLMVAFLLLLLFFLLAYFYRPWRLFLDSRRPSSSRASVTRADDLEKPLFLENFDHVPDLTSGFSRVVVSNESSFQTDANICTVRRHGITNQRFLPTDLCASQGDNLAVDIVSDTSEDFVVGQTLKKSAVANWPVEDVTHVRREDANYGLQITGDNCRHRVSGSRLSLEVISGPSIGLHCSRDSTNTSSLPLTIGRIAPNDLILKDQEVSGKHALINWNANRSKWELVDGGSLNGTLLNSKSVSHPGGRHRSEPVELANGDTITLGTSSKVVVEIRQHIEHHIPFGVGMASDPMSIRRGGRVLPMEDVCYCQWPLPGVEQFGLFGIFDGHGGDGAAKDASMMMPTMLTNIISNPDKKERIFCHRDASEVLRDVFSQTEAAMKHQYEGCTATVLLVWADHDKDLFVQCANVGDSACIMILNGTEINMTEDHRVTSLAERTRFQESGQPLRDGETRLYGDPLASFGLNLARALGDKFLKEQDSRFSSEPYVSQVVHITKTSTAFVLLASDGLWDVISFNRAVQLVLQAKEGYLAHTANSAKMIADLLLNEARTRRTTDNTSVIFLDFDAMRTESCTAEL